MSMRFFVPGIPVTQGSMKAFIPKGWSRAIVTHDKKKPLIAWRAAVAALAHQTRNGAAMNEGPLGIMLIFYLPRPKSLPKRVLFPIKKPDLDKLIRAIFDSIRGVLYKDDAQIVRVQARKYYAGDTQSCGVEISIEELDYPEPDEQPVLFESEVMPWEK